MTAAGWALLGVSLALTGIAAGTAWRAAGRAVAAERSAQWARRHAIAARDRARHYVDEAIAATANARGVDASVTTPRDLASHEAMSEQERAAHYRIGCRAPECTAAHRRRITARRSGRRLAQSEVSADEALGSRHGEMLALRDLVAVASTGHAHLAALGGQSGDRRRDLSDATVDTVVHAAARFLAAAVPEILDGPAFRRRFPRETSADPLERVVGGVDRDGDRDTGREVEVDGRLDASVHDGDVGPVAESAPERVRGAEDVVLEGTEVDGLGQLPRVVPDMQVSGHQKFPSVGRSPGGSGSVGGAAALDTPSADDPTVGAPADTSEGPAAPPVSVEGPAGDGEATAPSPAAAPGTIPEDATAAWVCPCGAVGYLRPGATSADRMVYEDRRDAHEESCPEIDR